MSSQRHCGVIMHISSLPNDYGIGKMGKEAIDFVDWLCKAGQHYWQILPISPTSFGDSPYQSFSIHAGNPYFIDFEQLEEDGLLKADDYKNIEWGADPEKVDYSLIYKKIWNVFRAAYARFVKDEDFEKFYSENSYWLDDYALFMALKEKNGGKAWYEWQRELLMCRESALNEARRELSDQIGFYRFLQYEFFKQWHKLKKYANEKGIEIIGDIPIYCALDSVDVWKNPLMYDLDEDKMPLNVAGCPPDGFAPLGQLWGNPVYDWDVLEKDSFKWWIDRIAFAEKLYDVVRIDHFRGFDSYYTIPSGNKDAVNGAWKTGKGKELFAAVRQKLGNVRIIAEDLGFITDSVRELLDFCGFPGMKMMQFGFDPNAESEYLPCNFNTKNCVCYTGTHDSDTIIGWYNSCSDSIKEFIRDYTGAENTDKDISDRFIRAAYTSIADTAMIQMQEALELGSEGRMNLPSTDSGNWQWRMKKGAATEALAKKLFRMSRASGRR